VRSRVLCSLLKNCRISHKITPRRNFHLRPRNNLTEVSKLLGAKTNFHCCEFCYSTQTAENVDQSQKDGVEKHEFQAETRMLLDIVAKSLYSDKEVFVRELISNCSDALEKLRYLSLTGTQTEVTDASQPEINIETDKQARTLTIQDNGVGMTKEEMIQHLGTIARSGSKAFLEKLKSSGSTSDSSSIIGQFGVGFYSSFMVADKVEVFSRSSSLTEPGHRWTSDGSGTYEIEADEAVKVGTKIVIHLKADCREFSTEDRIKEIISKYSNFVGFPINLNSKKINTIEALWLSNPKDVSEAEHTSFYKFIAGPNTFDSPRFTLHYKVDAPINIKALLYFPSDRPGMFDMSRDNDSCTSLYCRKVLIQSKANIFPKWLRFVKGVIDSEDIPLNLSRELLQESALINKLKVVLTNRILRFLYDKQRKDTESYDEFFTHYGLYLKEGILDPLTGQNDKEEIGRLLRYESSSKDPGQKVTLPEYVDRMRAGQKDIYYLAAPSRQLAETSPYFEGLKAKDVEVLFCYEAYDEIVLHQLQTFSEKPITSVEKEMRREKESVSMDDKDDASLASSEASSLVSWLSMELTGKAKEVKLTHRLTTHPCMITVEEMASARHFVKTQFHSIPEDQRYMILAPQLEINPSHPIIMKLNSLRTDNPKLASLIAQQLFGNAMVSAGLVSDPVTVMTNFNELLTLALEKH